MTKIEFSLQGEFIELYKLLKLESIADSGGAAKGLIAAGAVKLNGAVETRKRKKLVAGDQVQTENHSIHIQKFNDAQTRKIPTL